ncbi:J domain-containing protein [Paenibacillus apis]|uniref:J domain-containing protein n=1 Tax=Paenibacillus apis TaxID=1792174 RepID=A0A920CLX6_9BACL|nr:DnaJ domain-containing protein [Paenibacillus apis]GIO41517.1 hypothetical protein J41TS4_12750 [Paenibacillus apis]
MSDPYKIMELTPSASEEEIKQAYRRLAKKYHPDLNPGNESAKVKMQQINAAYEQIKLEREGGTSGASAGQTRAGASGPQGYGQAGNPFGQGNPYGQGNPFEDGDFYKQFNDLFGKARQEPYKASSPRMQAVFNFIERNQYQEALRTLSEMERDDEWFYASAIAHAGAGNRITALNHAQEAVRLNPNAEEYLTLLEQFQKGIFTYRQAGQGYGFDMNPLSKTLLQFCALQFFCLCCCRPC